MGNSLAAQWLGLGPFAARVQVQSLVGEISSHKPHGIPNSPQNSHFKVCNSTVFSCIHNAAPGLPSVTPRHLAKFLPEFQVLMLSSF